MKNKLIPGPCVRRLFLNRTIAATTTSRISGTITAKTIPIPLKNKTITLDCASSLLSGKITTNAIPTALKNKTILQSVFRDLSVLQLHQR